MRCAPYFSPLCCAACSMAGEPGSLWAIMLRTDRLCPVCSARAGACDKNQYPVPQRIPDHSRNLEIVLRDPRMARRIAGLHEQTWSSEYAQPIDVLKTYPKPAKGRE